MRGILLAAVLLGTVLVGFSAPKIQVDSELFDFGVAVDGDVIEFFVTITNAGNQRLTISRVSYNCSCTSYELPQRELNPGESVKMKIRFNTRGYSRYTQPVSQTVTLYTNDPARPQVIITVRGTVRTMSAYEAPAASLYQSFYLLLDVRAPEEFAKVHLLGAVNVPLAELEAWADKLPKTHIIYIVDGTGEKSAQAVTLLQKKGFLLARAIRGGLAGWWQELGDLFLIWGEGVTPHVLQGSAYMSTVPSVPPSQLARSFLVVVDVRRPEEFRAGHIAGAINTPLFTMSELADWARTLPPARHGYPLNIWIVDEDGSRACSITNYLRNQGFPDAKCLFGGMRAWTNQYGKELIWSEL